MKERKETYETKNEGDKYGENPTQDAKTIKEIVVSIVTYYYC